MHIQLKYCITYITILYNQKIIGAAANPSHWAVQYFIIC